MSNIEGRAGGPTLSLYCPVDEKTSVKLYCMPFVVSLYLKIQQHSLTPRLATEMGWKSTVIEQSVI